VQLQSPNKELGWDEADFEFLGTNSTSYYKIHTNLITNGTGGREQQFYFPFDPTTDFHVYSFFWTPQQIMYASFFLNL
jgi:xyloglucan:xyloglucosyl transferase